MGEQADDPELVRLAKAGEFDAIQELLYRHQRLIEIICLHFKVSDGLTDQDCDDVFQDVALKLFSGALCKWDPQISKLSTWIGSITTHCCLDLIKKNNRRNRRHAFSLDDLRHWMDDDDRHEEVAAPQDPPFDQVARNLDRFLVRQAVNRLSPDLREVILLVDFLGLNQTEAGQLLGKHPSTISKRYKAAFAGLKAELLDRRADLAYPLQRGD